MCISPLGIIHSLTKKTTKKLVFCHPKDIGDGFCIYTITKEDIASLHRAEGGGGREGEGAIPPYSRSSKL